jgi:hypothetical protein
VLIEDLRAQWRVRKASARVREVLSFNDDGRLTLGADTVLWEAPGWIARAPSRSDEARLKALLLAGYGQPADSAAVGHLKAATRCQEDGDVGQAGIHLALSRLGPLPDPLEASRRLFMTDGLMRGGVAPEAILEALGHGSETLARYSPSEPRVPAGNGRDSGEWASLMAALATAGAAARSFVGPATRMAGTAVTLTGRASAGLDLGSLGPKALGALTEFVAGLGEGAVATSAVTTAGVAAVFGVLFIPSSTARGQWVKVAGPGDISYRCNPDEIGCRFRYTTPDGVQHTASASNPDPDGNFKGPHGRIIARLVKTATRSGMLVSTGALLGQDTGEPKLCPAPRPDRNRTDLGREFEDRMKILTNPGKPTPSGFSYYLPGPSKDGFVSFDDCQRETGAVFEYKGPNFAKHMNKKDKYPWKGMDKDIFNQSKRQFVAKKNRSLTWVFAEQAVADHYRKIFNRLYGKKILVLSAAEYRGGLK